MGPSSERQRESHSQSDSRWLRPLAVLGFVALLVAAPVAAATAGSSPAPANADAAADTTTPTRTPEPAPHTAVSSGSSASAGATASGSERSAVQFQEDPDSIEYGDRVTAALTTDDPRSAAYRGYHDPITFQGSAGDAVTITMIAGGMGDPRRPTRPGREGAAFPDPYLILVAPDGDVVARADDLERSLNARIQGVVLPEDGEYTIVATSFDENGTFRYGLTLDDETDTGRDLRSIDLNETATGEIDKTDPFDMEQRGFYEPVTFEGQSGQRVQIDMGSRPGDTYLFLEGPDGNVIAENDDTRGLNSSIRTTLPRDGTYTIVATSFSREERFEYSLSVQVVGAGASGGTDLRQIRVGETRQSELDAADPSAPFLRGHFEPVTFEGRPGQSVTIDMRSDRGDTFLILYGPEGNVVARNDDFEGLNSRIETTLESGGEYTIIATSFDEEATFSYELSVEAEAAEPVEGVDLRSIEFGETAEGAIGPDDPRSEIYRGFYEPVTFEGSAGEEVQIDMTSRDDTFLILVGPNGTVLTSNDDFEGLDSRVVTTLPADGEYTIIATSFDPDASFRYELTLERADVTRG